MHRESEEWRMGSEEDGKVIESYKKTALRGDIGGYVVVLCC